MGCRAALVAILTVAAGWFVLQSLATLPPAAVLAVVIAAVAFWLLRRSMRQADTL